MKVSIIVVKSIDVESLPSSQVCVDGSQETELTLVVMAQDKGTPQLNSTVDAIIRITVSKSVQFSFIIYYLLLI